MLVLKNGPIKSSANYSINPSSNSIQSCCFLTIVPPMEHADGDTISPFGVIWKNRVSEWGNVVTERKSTGTVYSSESTTTTIPSASSHVEENVLQCKRQRMFELDASQPSPIAVFDCAFDAIKGAVLTDVWRLTKRDEEIRLPGSSVFDGDPSVAKM